MPVPYSKSRQIKGLNLRKNELLNAHAEVQSAVEEKKLVINDLETMRCYVADLKEVLGSASIMEQKAFLKSFVERIDVSNSQLTVNYTLPMPPSNTEIETMGVLDFERYGRPCRSRTCDTLIKSLLVTVFFGII
ncbi:hypothetical protein ACFLTP_08495 [Chloroflexota bacterium]